MTTDASNLALEAVLSRGGKPIIFISKTLNSTIKIIKWREFIEEFSPKIIYKLGVTNVVADALLRQAKRVKSIANRFMKQKTIISF